MKQPKKKELDWSWEEFVAKQEKELDELFDEKDDLKES